MIQQQPYLLGRIPSPPDANDLRYPIRRLLPEVLPPLRDRVWAISPSYRLDQGQTGTCVGHGGKHLLMAAPLRQTKPLSEPTAFTLYGASTKFDPWPENDPRAGWPNGDVQFGTTVRALADALRAYNFIESYWWITTTSEQYLDTISWEAALSWVCNRGPIVLGVDWYYSMFQPGADALIVVDERSGAAGGHCILWVGYDKRKKLCLMQNSWGLEWGDRGRAWIAEDRLRWLLSRPYAEGLVAVERLVA